METQEVSGGLVTGYSEARVERTVAICAQGAAHGAWKEMMWRVDGGVEAMCFSQSARLVISVIVDIVRLRGSRTLFFGDRCEDSEGMRGGYRGRRNRKRESRDGSRGVVQVRKRFRNADRFGRVPDHEMTSQRLINPGSPIRWRGIWRGNS